MTRRLDLFLLVMIIALLFHISVSGVEMAWSEHVFLLGTDRVLSRQVIGQQQTEVNRNVLAFQPVGVTACKAHALGLQTRAFMDRHSVRICQSAGQHSVQTSQHSYANGLQTYPWTNTPCK